MSWIANIFLILGVWYAGKLRWYAFPLIAVGELLWALVGFWRSSWDIVLISVIFFILAIKNSYHWFLNYLKTKKENLINGTSKQ